MTGPHNRQPDPTPPEDFVKQVKDALEQLYDFPALQRHPLAASIDGEEEATAEVGARRLRQDLIAAIEMLNPGNGVAAHSPQSRTYSLLVLRYIEGRTVQEVAHEVGVSPRQVHRDLRRGEQGVAEILWARRAGRDPKEKGRARRLSSLQQELSLLVTHARPVDLRDLLARSLDAVKHQAAQFDILLAVSAPDQPVIISTDAAVSQQVLINTLSHAIRQAQPGRMVVDLKSSGDHVLLRLAYAPQSIYADARAYDDVIVQLAGRLGWQLRQQDSAGERGITIEMTAQKPTILVIDDNEGLVQLVDDYLSGHSCRVAKATSGVAGLKLAQDLGPDAILLDVMIPDMDGWEVLQRLRANPQTSGVPVIICSVLNSPELAYSLGATATLAKPISRDDILAALHQIGVV